MLNSSAAFQTAVSSRYRKILLRASVSVIDPDIVYGEGAGSSEAAWSRPEQLADKVLEQGTRYATLEPGRWLLDGRFSLISDDNVVAGQVGFVGDTLSGEDGSFAGAAWVEQRFSGVSILQTCSIFFSSDPADGIAEDFTVEIRQGGVAYHTATFIGNTKRSVIVEGFTVYDPDAIRVVVTKWSLPARRVRVMEIVPGLYEAWDGSMIATLAVKHQGDISSMALPYGTARLKLNNVSRRFEPRYKAGIFKSIEERQAITFEMGFRLADGSSEYKSIGVFFQAGDGWKTSDNSATIVWDMIDIVGLVADRTFIVPEALPTTLAGWVSTVVAQLGKNLAGWWHVDPAYAEKPVTALSAAAVTGKKCGDILRWACQATGTFVRADSETGYLTVEPLWSQGGKILLHQVTRYPTMKANPDIALLIFKLSDGTEYLVSGNSASSRDTKTIVNPFLHTQAQALTAARMILSTYGGNRLETSGTGDPTAEIGDVDTVWLDESSATTGRRILQTFEIIDGVPQACQSVLLQADGSFQFEERVVLTGTGEWTSPAGVTQLRVIVGQAGQGGGPGADGVMTTAGYSYEVPTSPGNSNTVKGDADTPDGANGADGKGGKIWYGTINVNPGQAFQYSCGEGGAPGSVVGQPGPEGGETSFGAYSSANGSVYPLGFTDVASGDSFGRSGVSAPLDGSGDGGKGGAGGRNGIEVFAWLDVSYGPPELVPGQGWVPPVVGWEPTFKTLTTPQKGEAGAKGGDGFIVIYYDKGEVDA